MDFISASGTGCAAPIAASEVSPAARAGWGHRFARRLGAALAVVALLPGAMPVADLRVEVTRMRSTRGVLRVCLTADPGNFPACVDDAQALTRSVAAATSTIDFPALPQGDYAIAVIHNENANNKLDSFAGIPREGFGFSRNPPLGFGPPRFAAARFALAPGQQDGDAELQQVRLRYLL